MKETNRERRIVGSFFLGFSAGACLLNEPSLFDGVITEPQKLSRQAISINVWGTLINGLLLTPQVIVEGQHSSRRFQGSSNRVVLRFLALDDE